MADALWTSRDIAAVTGGRQVGPAFEATGVSIDSREVVSGDLFVALTGERDGHLFTPGALSAGASGVLASKPVNGPHVLVQDTLKALEALGAAARDRSLALRAAVTGSVGKTSVTQAIAAGLAAAGRWHSSVKSYNNHIGVPLTLARMPWATERAVFEIGMNHADEISPLSKMVRPEVVVVTTVGPVHIENFPDAEAGVARAKAEIFDGVEPGGVAILNADNRWFDLLALSARAAGARVLSFGSGEGCDARLLDFSSANGHASVRATIHGQSVSFPLLQTGLRWGLNSLCALLALEAVRIDGGAFTLIDESYNANPISMAAALKTLGVRQERGRRIVALTDMLELGPEAPAFHAALAAPIEAANVDQVFCAGPMMKSLWDALPPTRRGGYADSAADIAPLIASAVEPGDLVMVKGSNGSRASVIAAALAALDHSGEMA